MLALPSWHSRFDSRPGQTARSAPVIENQVAIVAVLLAVLAALFTSARHRFGARFFGVVPLLVFAYFMPTLLSNFGLIPLSSPAYQWIKNWLLPASLILLTLSVDLPAVLRLGKPALILFLSATLGIVIGGPLAYLALGWLIPAELGDQAWKGLAALSGSWIGGTANFVAIGESVGTDSSTLSLMVVVDVAVANVWMAVLLYWSGRAKKMDERIGADDRAVSELRDRVQAFQEAVRRPTNLPDMLNIAAIAIGGAVVCHELGQHLPTSALVSGFTWVAILATTIGVLLSFTPVRRLEGAGASAIGSLFLYLLIASIGAQAEFARVVDAPALVAVGALWIVIHALIVMVVRRLVRAPIFFAAVGSQANVGGAASAPVVAAAFHPALAPVGVLLAVAGYALGTYAALVCAFLLERVHSLYF